MVCLCERRQSNTHSREMTQLGAYILLMFGIISRCARRDQACVSHILGPPSTSIEHATKR